MEKSSFGIYPNPVNNMLYFTGNETIDRVQINNVLGQTVQSYTKLQSNSINVENLANGIYLISVETKEGEIATARFIKK